MKLNLRSVDLNLLPVFDAIMEAGQLSLAAQTLGMSQPAISAALQRLRQTFGDQLFVRTHQGMSPTPRARELHQSLAHQLASLRDTLDPSNRFDPGTSLRRFSIQSVDYFEMVILPRLLADVRASAPGVTLQVTPADDSTADALHMARSDLAVDAFIPEDGRLCRRVLMEETLVVVARQHHSELRGRCSRGEFLAAEHVVLPDRNRRLPLDQILDAPGWQRRTGAQVSQFAGMLATCSQSDMIATVPERLALQYANAMGLQVLPFPVRLPPIPVYMIWPFSMDKDPAHQWLRHKLAESVQS